MYDLISRSAAIDAHCEVCGDRDKCNCDICPDVEVFQLLSSAQPEPQWIPCSERLPMVSGEFLVTLTDEDGEWVSTAEWNTTFGGRWQDVFIDDGYRDISNVIAWQPLPEPYREEGEKQ